MTELSSRDAVLQAIGECDRLAEEAFVKGYGFGPSLLVRVLHEGETYPAEAIVGAAHGYEFPEQGPLNPSECTSGDSTMKLKQLGFDTKRVNAS